MPIFDDRSAFAREVEEELEAMEASAKSRLRSLLIVVGSLVLFLGLGLVSTSLSGVLVLIVVLLVHEFGHFVAMKLSGYRDVQMFFIPLFGAAVSGAETVPSGTRRAIVALSGPVPGLVIGLLCALIFHATGGEVVKDGARTFLLVNAFNLLPFMPLDGGQFMEAVLFSRHPLLRAGFDVIGGAALAVLAWMTASVPFGLLAFLMFRSVTFTYRSGHLARDLKDELARQGESPIAVLPAGRPRRIPAEYIERLIPFFDAHMPEALLTPRGVALALRQIWNMVWFKPPSVIASIALVITYVLCFGFGVLATIGAEVSFGQVEQP